MNDFKDLEVELSLGIGVSGANQRDKHKVSEFFTEDEWNSLSNKDRDEALWSIASDWADNYIDIGYCLK